MSQEDQHKKLQTVIDEVVHATSVFGGIHFQ